MVGSSGVSHEEPLKGTTELYSLLYAIQHPESLKAILDDLEKKRAEINQAVDKLGKWDEIELLHKHATEAANQADRIVEEAASQKRQWEEQFRVKVDAENSRLERANQALKDKNRELDEMHKARMAELDKHVSDASANKSASERLKAEAQKLFERAKSEADEASKDKTFWSEKAKKLKEIL